MVNKYIVLLLLVFLFPLLVDTEYHTPVTGGTLPYQGTVCSTSPVYGGPDASIFPTFGTVQAGTVVTLRELSKPTGTWVMIQRARWIPLRAICKWN